MTDRRGRLRGRRGPLAVIRHAQPEEAVIEAQAPQDLTEPLDLPDAHRLDDPRWEVPGGPLEILQEVAADVSRETSAEESDYCANGHHSGCGFCGCDCHQPPPALRASQVARLEALTALWVRQTRLEAPADATLVYSAPRPPVPPRKAAETPGPAPTGAGPDPDPEPVPAPVEVPADWVDPGTITDALLQQQKAAGPPRRVSDWTSRHDPRSLDYAVRGLLSRPVPIQDRVLEIGPVLDQGTTPPLSERVAAACTGMAGVAAANVLELATTPGSAKRSDVPFLGVEEARHLYFRAQDLDHRSGHDYAGTSVLAVMQAGQEAGYWDRYLWALGGTRDVAQVLLQLGVAIVVGVPWGTGLETPDAGGVIVPTGLDGTGHALAVVGIRRRLRDGRPGPWFVLQQSRGEAEGDRGLVYLHHTHLAALLRGVGEAAVPLTPWIVQGLGL